MKKKLLIIILFLLFTPSLLLCAPKEKNIMLINSYHQGYRWTDDITKGVTDVLENSKEISLSIEYLDTKKNTSNSYFASLEKFYQIKMKQHKYDLVICSDNNAFNFVLDNRYSIFRNIPIVFCGVNYFDKNEIKGYKNITGVNEDVDINRNFKLIFRLHPKTKKIICITDTTVTGKRVKKQLIKVIDNYKADAEFEIVDDISMENLKLKLSSQSPNTIVYYTVFFKDSKGTFYEYDDSIRLISEYSNVPVYGSWDFSLGFGIVGGYLTSGYHQGIVAARQAVAIVNGTSPANVQIEYNSPKKYMFDYRFLAKHKIDQRKLPMNSVIVNLPNSFYKRNKIFVWNISISFTILILIIVSLVVNIIKRNKAEKSLRKIRQYLFDIINSMPSPLVSVDENHRIKNLNNKAREILSNRTSKVLIGSKIEELVPEIAEDSELIDGVLRTGKNILIENKEMSFNSTNYRVMISVYKLNFPYVTEAVIRFDDVSEHYKQKKHIERLQNILHGITDSVEAVLITVDSNLGVVIWNYAAELNTGIKEEDAVGRNLVVMIPKLKPHAEKILKAVNEIEISKINKLQSFENNVIKVEDVEIYPLKSKELKGAVIRIEDVTEKVKLDELIVQSEKMLSLGGMAAGMAHEINNPLAGIMQSAQFLKIAVSPEFEKNRLAAEECDVDLEAIMQYMQKRKMIEMIDYIQQSGERAAGIVKNMLNFSRKSSQQTSNINISDLIDDTVLIAQSDYDLKEKYDFKKISIEKNYDKNLPIISGYKSELQQVFFNILRNGAQAMYEDSECHNPIFRIRIENLKSKIRISIFNNGPVIPDYIRKKIFEPFFTTKKVGSGTGLGLSVSYYIIAENHGGELSVDSSLDGVAFNIVLPVNGVKQ